MHDLDADWDEVMAAEPGFGIYGDRPGKGALRIAGRGFGRWKIVRLEPFEAGDE